MDTPKSQGSEQFAYSILLGIALIAVAGIGGSLGGRLLRRPNGAPGARPNAETATSIDGAGLSISRPSRNFGAVWENPVFEWPLAVTNSSDRLVTIVGFAPSCKCSSVSPPRLAILPSQTRTVVLKLDLRVAVAGEKTSQAKEAPFSVSISPLVEEGDTIRPATAWVIEGRIKKTLQPEIPFLDVGRRSELANAPRPRRVPVQAFNGISELKTTTDSPFVHVRVERVPLPHSRFELVVEIRPGLPSGRVDLPIQLTPVLEDGRRLPTIAFPIRGWIVGDVDVTPPLLSFGPRPLGEMAKDTVTLKSLTGQSFEVVQARAEAPGLSVSRVGPADGKNATYSVSQQVRTVGQSSSGVVFTVKTGTGQLREMRVPVSSYGTQPVHTRARR